MDIGSTQSGSQVGKMLSIRRLYGLLAPRAYSVIIFGALFCTLAAKFFHSWRTNLVSEYFSWILADISVLLGIEVVLASVCFRWPRKSVIRVATVVAALVCIWSVMNAGWLIRTGTQFLPSTFLSLFRDPIGILGMVGVNLIKMPKAAVALLAPSAITLAFLVFVLAKPLPPAYSRRRFGSRVIISSLFIILAVLGRGAVAMRGSAQTIYSAMQGSAQTVSEELRYNCQLRAVTSIFSSGSNHWAETDFADAERKIPSFDELENALTLKSSPKDALNRNVVIVVLEGIQYRYTSLADKQDNLTPYLATLAEQGVEFANARSSVPHTNKALFALLTGRFPSPSQDVAEAVPVAKPYASIASILKHKLNFRTACFESANGSFECWPGLAYNLGFDKFWAREDLNDPNAFVGYFASDEFSMLKPITEWIKADERPFCLVIMCSVSHDPYVVPKWFATPAKEPIERYRQTISYTDKFLAALDAELGRLGIAGKTILCVISDHGEAFGEHGFFAHERIMFEEALRIPWVMRAPSLLEPGAKVTEPVSSVDLTPTLLALAGFETKDAGFDGVNALGTIPADRKVYFSCWTRLGPAGFVKGSHKFIYNPANKMVCEYDLSSDPLESVRLTLPEHQAQHIAEEIIAWRKDSIFQIQQRADKIVLFDRWLCHSAGRVSSAQYETLN
jgi:phosphoglycerol transferase MdoB-like AlkP superfamily enzyme